MNVKIVAAHAGITVGEDGSLHQSIEDIALMSALPNMTVIVPAEQLEKENIIARVINISTIKPIDEGIILKAARETKAIITAEEHSVIGGLGAMASSVVSEKHPTIVKKIGISDNFGESGTPDELMEKYGLTYEEIVKAVEEVLG